MYRDSYVEINLKGIENNVKKLINRYCDYTYYIGVVKAHCYGHNRIEVVQSIVNSGCNYLAVATLDEALEIREILPDIKILCLGVVNSQYVSICAEKNISITVNSLEYLYEIINCSKTLTIHLKINTGMNRLGINNSEDLNKAVSLIKDSSIYLEGIYTHIYNFQNIKDTKTQFELFEQIVSRDILLNVPIVHIGGSEAVEFFDKPSWANGCRIGIAMYGLVNYPELSLDSTFSVYSKVVQINDVSNGVVGYDGAYKVNSSEKIAVVGIGYADGIIRKNSGRYVFINDKKFRIVGNICMDMLFVKVDDSVHVGDSVVIIKDNNHINDIAKHLETIPYEVICSIGARVPRICK